MEHTSPAGQKPPEGGERGSGAALRGLLGPLLLCFAVVCLARLVAWQNARIAEMTAENRWLEQARGEIERFRGGWTYAHQVEAGMDRLRRSVAAMLKSRDRSSISGGEFSRLFRQAIPATHRPPGTQVFAFRLNAAGMPETMSGPGLETAMGRMVGGLLAAALDPDAVPAARRTSLDRQSTGLFGELITLDVVARLRRGKLTGARWRGGDSLMLWNAVEMKRETLCWIALFPRNAMLTSRPVETALRKGASRGRGRLWPVLAPLLPENGAVRLRTASDTVPAWPLRRLQAAIAGCRSRNDLAPAGTIVRALPGLWAIRDIVASNLPFELWLVGPVPPEARRDTIPPWEQALRAGLFGLMALLTARRVMNPAGSDMSLRVWFAGFVTLVGILPLGLVWLLASWWITMNVERRVGESERQAEERFMRLDLMSAREVDRFAGACSTALVDRPLLERLTRVPEGEAGQVAIEAEHRRLAAAGVPAEYMQVFRPGRDAFVSTLPGMNDRPNRGLFQLQTGMVAMAVVYNDKNNSEKYIKALSGRDRMAFEGIRSAFSSGFGAHYFDVRRRGHLFRGSDEPLFMTYDFFADASGFGLGVVFATRARQHFASLLREEIARLRLMMPGARIAWGMSMPGGFEPIGEHAGTLSPGMTRVLHDAARAGTMQVHRTGERRYIARPCQRMPGFIVGMEFSTAGIRREAAGNLLLVEGVLAVIVSILFLIGLGIGRHLLQPLSRLETGLRRAAAGDLDSRVGIDRPDEIGEVTRAFDRMIDGLRERRDLGRFVSATLEHQLQAGEVTGAPQVVDGVVLVSDLRSFTTISESYPVEEVVEMLNRHLDAMAGAIHAAGGKIDRFIGDAVIAAFYGERPEENAARALDAAVAMLRAHRRLRDERRARGLFEYGMGVGLDAGNLLVGSFGTAERMERAVLGEPREVAERLEAASKKGRHTAIMLSDAMLALLGGPSPVFERIPAAEAWELAELPQETGA